MGLVVSVGGGFVLVERWFLGLFGLVEVFVWKLGWGDSHLKWKFKFISLHAEPITQVTLQFNVYLLLLGLCLLGCSVGHEVVYVLIVLYLEVATLHLSKVINLTRVNQRYLIHLLLQLLQPLLSRIPLFTSRCLPQPQVVSLLTRLVHCGVC